MDSKVAGSNARECLISEFDGFHYVPVLYARAAETSAVASLPKDTEGKLSPIWVIPPVATDPKTEAPKKTRAEHVTDVGKSLLKSWGSRPAFVDTHQYVLSEKNRQGVAAEALETFEQLGLKLVPVFRDDMTPPEATELFDFAFTHNRDVCLRLSGEIWAGIGTPAGDAEFARLVSLTGAKARDIHLVIDLQDQLANPASVSAVAVRGAMSQLENANEWRTLTLLGTAMPGTTAEVGRNGTAEIPRSEWMMWKLVRELRMRKMSFGDYAIQSVDSLSTFNPLYMQTAAQMRYTISNAWFVARGTSTRSGGFKQAHDLAKKITGHAEFSGRNFSNGDEWLANCAVKASSSGNATTWRRATTNHHLVMVIRQLANLRGA